MARCAPLAAGLAALALVAAAVQGVVAAGWISALIVPLPSDVGRAIAALLASGELESAFLATFGVMLVSSTLAVVLGIPAGYILYRYHLLGRAYESWLGAAFASPHVLLYPLFLVVFGRTYITLGVMGTLAGIIPIVLGTRLGLARAPRTLVDVGRSFNCTPAQQFWKVLFPAAVPILFSGIRLGLIYALVNIIGVEFLINFGGLGRLVSDTYDRFDIPAMYAAIAFIVLISALLFAILDRVQARLRPL